MYGERFTGMAAGGIGPAVNGLATLVSRRSALTTSSLGLAALTLPGCGADEVARSSSKTRVHVMGTIHRRHLSSELYSLSVLEAAIRKASPDVILTEIPPRRVKKALSSWRETGEVTEPRTRVFPEYTDVVIPLADAHGWRVMGTAGWTEQIAVDRRAALDAISDEPSRALEWAEHREALRTFVREVAGRSDDPRFIHTDEFDALVAASREPYAQHFDKDLGAGGWTQINDAHTRLINSALDLLSGKGLSALITFGTAHKYKILESLAQRSDIALEDTRALFD